MLIELRIYTIAPGMMETWLTAFHEELQPMVEALGAKVLGSFVRADAPDEFVWLRAFADAQRREAFRQAFQESPVWLAMRDRIQSMLPRMEVRLIAPTAFSAIR